MAWAPRPDHPQLVIRDELRALRKGQGILAGDLASRLRVNLRTLCSIGDQDSTSAVRDAVIARLLGCVDLLSDELDRISFLVSVAIHPEARLPRFDDRVGWLANYLRDRNASATSETGVKRRIAKAELEMAGLILEELRRRQPRTSRRFTGWYLRRLDTVVDLSTPDTTVYELRTIVATRDGLRQVVVCRDLPTPDGLPSPSLHVRLHRSTNRLQVRHPMKTRVEITVDLPHALMAGHAHEFELVLTVPGGLPRPHYVITPELPLIRFTLTLMFGVNRRPRWLRRVEDEKTRWLDSPIPPVAPVHIPDDGQVRLQFDRPGMDRAYGAQWQL